MLNFRQTTKVYTIKSHQKCPKSEIRNPETGNVETLFQIFLNIKRWLCNDQPHDLFLCRQMWLFGQWNPCIAINLIKEVINAFPAIYSVCYIVCDNGYDIRSKRNCVYLDLSVVCINWMKKIMPIEIWQRKPLAFPFNCESFISFMMDDRRACDVILSFANTEWNIRRRKININHVNTLFNVRMYVDTK